MLYDFSASGKSARALIPVPDVPLHTIRSRARATAAARTRIFAIAAVIVLALFGAGVSLGARVYQGVQLWLSGGKAAVAVHSFTIVHYPMEADVRSIVSRATFPVVLPVGLPAGSRLVQMMYAPQQRPNMIILRYQNPQGNRYIGFSLFDTKAIGRLAPLPGAEQGAMPARRVGTWHVGQETVIVMSAFVSSDVGNRVKAAMMQASPDASLAATDAMVTRISVQGGPLGPAVIGERIAPPGAKAVVLGRQQIAWFPKIAERGAPLHDARTVYLYDIPTVNGVPEYSKAMLFWPKSIAISAHGVRAIEAMLRFTGTRADCGCELLFVQPNATKFSIWKIPVGAGTPQKYSVDAKTLAVTIE